MIKNIIKDDNFLSLKSEDASLLDKDIITNLKDTLMANKSRCVGMAANMIGELKNIIVILIDDKPFIMVNPKIIMTYGLPYVTKEGCLCRIKQIETKRYDKIKVEYLDEDFKKRIKTFEGFTSQIIQHEIDHTLGIIV